jgi:NADH-quinone oxidoreductase subunit M
MTGFPVLTVLTLLPVAGAVLALLAGRQRGAARNIALAFSGISLLLALAVWFNYDTSSGEIQYVERHSWVPSIGANYFLGVDGLGVLMVLLSAIVVPMAILASAEPVDDDSLYYALILLLQSGLFGAFTALNFFHWFIFWELSLIPAFFLVRLWGGSERATASTQFFVYTMAGSVAMLLGFLAIFLATGKFDFPALAELARAGGLPVALAAKIGWAGMGTIAFVAVFLGFAVKVPLMPFHTWLPAVYSEAPCAVTMLLTGAMSKMGVYGFIRIVLPIFAGQMGAHSRLLLWLAVITIVFSACAAFAQRDLKRILAYSSINHLGYCLLGVFAASRAVGNDPGLVAEKVAALNGVMLQMFNHGITAAALFWFVALIERRSGGLRGLDDFGGIRQVAPVFCGLMGIALFSSLGLPGLNGFVGEFLIFKGVFPLAPRAAILAAPGLLVSAIFILTILQRVFNGPLNPKWAAFPDLTLRERAALAPCLVLMLVLGLYPQLAVGLVNHTAMIIVKNLSP